MTVSATLADETGPLAGQLVSLRVGTSIQTVMTDASGVASVVLPLADTPGPTQVAAAFGGNATTKPSDASKPFTINKLGTSLALAGAAGGLPGSNSDVYATLKDANDKAVPFRSVIFVVSNDLLPGAGFTRQVSTGFDGRAALGPVPSLTPGVYKVRAYFTGSITLNPWATPTTSISLVDPTYTGSSAGPLPLGVFYPFQGFFQPVDNLPTVNLAKAGSSIPIKFSLGGNRGLGILAGTPVVVQTACPGTNVIVDAIETVVTSNSGLQYGGGQYTYVWKSSKAYAGKCYRFDLRLVDGQTYSANFKFK